MRAALSSGQQAAVSAGPWYAYLRPDMNGGNRRSEPILLSQVHIEGSGYPLVASVTFRVPDVGAGYYWVDVCDLGCTQGVGDLVGGTIVLGVTDSEARLFARGLIFRWMHDFDARRIGALQKQRGQLQAAVSKEEDAVRAANSRANQASERATDALARVEEVQGLLEDTVRQRNLLHLVGGLSLLAFLLAIAAVLVLRRRLRIVVPDSPAELIDQDAKPGEAVKPSS